MMKQHESLCSNKLLPPLFVLTLVFLCKCSRCWLLPRVNLRNLFCFSRLQHEDWFDSLTTGHRPPRGEKTEGCGGVAMDRRKVCMLMVLWAIAHFNSPGYGLRALRRTTGGHRGSTGLRGQDANGVPLRRSKRGWMWNQFFLLEEYTGTDLQYVGKVV